MNLPITDPAAFAAYALTMSVTPGPNNALLATLGARHGFRGAVPAAAGVMAGLFGLLLVAGTGLGAAFTALPPLKAAMTAGGVAYMAWLACTLWSAGGGGTGPEAPAVGFWGAVALQAANPKAVLMALTAAGSFLAPGSGALGSAQLAACFVALGAPCVALWMLLGDRLRTWLRTPRRARAFYRAMALLVALTAASVLLHG